VLTKIYYFAGMKRQYFFFLFLLFCAYACNNKKKETNKSENDIDAAREFIRSALDGEFDKARGFMLPDSLNIQYMDAAERSYNKSNTETKHGYRGSSIRMFSPVVKVNDSTTIIVFANSFMNDPDTLRVLRQHGQWLVDLKYLYEHNMDTTRSAANPRDSL
jgi:hypothetical protein